MKPFSTFYDHLLPELPGCTTAMLDLHLRQVARDFCLRTSAWREDFPAIMSQGTTLSYFLVTPEAKTDLVRLLKLTVNGCLLWMAVDAQRIGPWDAPCNQEQPLYPPAEPPFSIDGDGQQITLTQQPTGLIETSGAIQPSMTATSLPDFLFNDYLEAMRTGVLSRLMLMAKKPWTDRQLAAFYASEYARLLNTAGAKAQNGNTRKLLRTRPWG